MRRPALLTCIAAIVLCPLLAAGSLVGASTVTSHKLPSVTGGFGVRPTITFPSEAPPSDLVSKVLVPGKGAVVTKGALLIANYLGQIWRGKVFDTSFGRGLSDFPIGIGKVIPGWDKALVGARIGSRLLLVIPPAEGYGPKGQPSAGITGKDTLVFVVDIVASYPQGTGGSTHATVLHTSVGGIRVSGGPGEKPSVSIAKGTPAPTTVSATILARANGPKITKGLLIFQIVATDWTGKVVDSSWVPGTPNAGPVGDPSQSSILDVLVGTPIGSRVLLELPETQNSGPFAVVIDVVADLTGTT